MAKGKILARRQKTTRPFSLSYEKKKLKGISQFRGAPS
jgi:hypothetical protein